MKKKIIEYIENVSSVIKKKDFLEDRVEYIGGSEISRLIDFKTKKEKPKLGTPFTLYYEKINDQTLTNDNCFMQYGRLHEPLIFRWIEILYRNTLKIYKLKDTLISKKYNFLGGHLDAVCHYKRKSPCYEKNKLNFFGVEIKTTAKKDFSGVATIKGIPVQYYAQIQLYIFLTNFNVFYMVCKFECLNYAEYGVLYKNYLEDLKKPLDEYGEKIQRFKIERDNEFIEKMINNASNFWYQNVLKKAPPVPVISGVNIKCIKEFGEPNFTPSNLEYDEILTETKKIIELQANIEKLQNQEKALKAKIKEYMNTQGVDYLFFQEKTLLVYKTKNEVNRLNLNLLKTVYKDVYKGCLQNNIVERMHFWTKEGEK